MTQTPSPADVLACPMIPNRNDANAATIGDYLAELLVALWKDQDEFSGKRPFGNTDWSSDLELALVQAGMVPGVVDEEGHWLVEVDQDAANELILAAIRYLPTLWAKTETAAAADPVNRETDRDTALLLESASGKRRYLIGATAFVLSGGALLVRLPSGTERTYASHAWTSFGYVPTADIPEEHR